MAKVISDFLLMTNGFCPACRNQAAIITEQLRHWEPQAALRTIDIAECVELAVTLHVSITPALIIRGKLVCQGPQTTEPLNAAIRSALDMEKT